MLGCLLPTPYPTEVLQIKMLRPLFFAIIAILLYTTIAHVDRVSNCQDTTDAKQSTTNGNQEGSCSAKEPPKVRIANGVLRGIHISSVSGKPVEAFLGIPFAETPVGPLRFKRPVPYKDDFNGEFDATNLPNTCPQQNLVPDIIPEDSPLADSVRLPTPLSEDCLFLNVWVPSLPSLGKRNIFYYVHEGGFNAGTSSTAILNGATLAAETNSIVVTTNYRLGPLGFLYLGTEDAPGNQGLLDQVEALRWIHKNIHAFGGDPAEVTVMGMSAGGMSSSYHLLSPLSQPLFKRAVIMSGVATAYMAYKSPEESLNTALEFAQKANCSEPINPTTAIKCLRNIDASTLVKVQFMLKRTSMLAIIPLAPTVDGHFLHDSPKNLIQNKKIPVARDILIGTTENECGLSGQYYFPEHFSMFKPSSISKEFLSSAIHTLFPNYNKIQRDAIVYEYQDHEHGQDVDGRNERLLSHCLSDYSVVCPSKDFADNWSALGGRVFVYYLTHYTESDPLGWLGMKHADDLQYFFGHALNPEAQYTVEERILSQRILLLLGNFARTGTPSPNWKPYTIENQVYADLNSKNASSASTIHFGPRARQCAFWNNFFPKLKNVGSEVSP